MCGDVVGIWKWSYAIELSLSALYGSVGYDEPYENPKHYRKVYVAYPGAKGSAAP